MKVVLLSLAATLLWAGEGWSAAVARPLATFHGTVYQIDTVFNFIDVIMPGGRKRFYADDATVVQVHRRRAALIDIAMGEEVCGTYRTEPRGARVAMTINDLTRN